MEELGLVNMYSTTRLLKRLKPAFKHNQEHSLENFLFLKGAESRQSEGGLRTQGYFKQNYSHKPLITIITVVFNGAKFLEKTIQSVINQTYSNVEYIIIDGRSTDGTLDIILKYEHAINYWVSESDGGIYDAMNKATKHASGKFVNFLNAGDYFTNLHILEAVAKEFDADTTILYGNTIVTDGKKAVEIKAKGFTIFKLFFWGTRVLCHQAMFVRVKAVIPYNLIYRLKAELDWYFELLNQGAKSKFISIPICVYSLGGVSDQNFKLEMLETIKVMFRRNPILAFIHMPVLTYKLIKRITK
jgi:glycosyltransferase involved in cell wall biosynthesis